MDYEKDLDKVASLDLKKDESFHNQISFAVSASKVSISPQFGQRMPAMHAFLPPLASIICHKSLKIAEHQTSTHR